MTTPLLKGGDRFKRNAFEKHLVQRPDEGTVTAKGCQPFTTHSIVKSKAVTTNTHISTDSMFYTAPGHHKQGQTRDGHKDHQARWRPSSRRYALLARWRRGREG